MKVSLRLSLAEFVGETQPSALSCPFLYRTKAFGKLLLAAVGSESLKQNPVSRFLRSKALGKWVFTLMMPKSLRQMDTSTGESQNPQAKSQFTLARAFCLKQMDVSSEKCHFA